MTSNGSETGSGMGATEQLVRTRLESAVGGLSIDAAPLVSAGTTAGRQLSHRRRCQQVGVGVVSAAVIAAGGIFGVQSGLFAPNAISPADHGEVTGLVPSNPRALAAAVIAKLPDGAHVHSVTGSQRIPTSLDVRIKFSAHGQTATLTVAAFKPSKLGGPVACAVPDNVAMPSSLRACGNVVLPNGRHVFAALSTNLTSGQPGLDLFVSSKRRGIGVTESVAGADSVSHMPLTRAGLAEIVFDRSAGLTTTRDMVAKGAALQQFRPAGSR